jgi:hypothetical protein
MKIVLSNFGYFTHELINKYFELSGLGKPYFYNAEISTVTENFRHIYHPSDEERYSFYISKNDLGINAMDNDLFSADNYFNPHDIPRDDKNLVLTIELLKPREFKVIEIPDDVKWYIHENDSGYESIHEEHRSWS